MASLELNSFSMVKVERLIAKIRDKKKMPTLTTQY
jgi:hypothetical protein